MICTHPQRRINISKSSKNESPGGRCGLCFDLAFRVSESQASKNSSHLSLSSEIE